MGNEYKKEVVADLKFGDSVAENEPRELQRYFVTTNQWSKLYRGDVDIVYGPKGSGKSALYSLLQTKAASLESQRRIRFVPAENPRGALAFKALITDPPASEQTFAEMWKLYFLTLVGEVFQSRSIANDSAASVLWHLRQSGLLPKQNSSLTEKLAAVFNYVRSRFRIESLEGGAAVAGVEWKGKITFAPPEASEAEAGVLSVDTLLEQANEALVQDDSAVWLGLDRLDVAFTERPAVETAAIRALFRTYLDFRAIPNLGLKIFLRTDIWDRITESGFTEASHITRTTAIEWTPDLLLNLLMRRALQSDILCTYYAVDRDQVLNESVAQKRLFRRMFPDQIEVGDNRPKTLDWMIRRIQDGTGYAAPRELIQLLTFARDDQMSSIEIGETQPPRDVLFAARAFKVSVGRVSRLRLEQTLYAEYPSLKPYIQKLQGEKAGQSIATLASIWKKSGRGALQIAEQLHRAGFFEKVENVGSDAPSFVVPFLYRDALGILRGKAEREE